jgi:hypothetical protein
MASKILCPSSFAGPDKALARRAELDVGLPRLAVHEAFRAHAPSTFGFTLDSIKLAPAGGRLGTRARYS